MQMGGKERVKTVNRETITRMKGKKEREGKEIRRNCGTERGERKMAEGLKEETRETIDK